ncbi:MAG: cobalamin-dependent protein, partial [Acidobacteria bacterium]|nr:cobalamin-dependent protein [Acidobacteriota bacterium]
MAAVKILLLSITNERITHDIEDIGICCIAAFMRQKGYQVMVQRVKENLLNYNAISDYTPDIIGVSIYTLTKESVYRSAAKLKQVLPGVIICAGGPLPTYSEREVLEECPAIDFLVRGEGEFTFLELAAQFPLLTLANLKNIKGLAYRGGNDG